jgi:hypothetical protein
MEVTSLEWKSGKIALRSDLYGCCLAIQNIVVNEFIEHDVAVRSLFKKQLTEERKATSLKNIQKVIRKADNNNLGYQQNYVAHVSDGREIMFHS